MDLAAEAEDPFPDPVGRLPGPVPPASQSVSPEILQLRDLDLVGCPEERRAHLVADLADTVLVAIVYSRRAVHWPPS